MDMRIGARNKSGYLTGATAKPSIDDPTYDNWVTENKRVKKIDHRKSSSETIVNGVVQMHSSMARLRVHIFLSGLDSDFDQVRGEILRKDPKLDLESTYAYVHREHRQRITMGRPAPTSDSSALLSQVPHSSPVNYTPKHHKDNSSGKPLLCSHCGDSGHSRLVAMKSSAIQHSGTSANASDHMIHYASILKHCFPCSNGGSASITSQGTITLSKTLTLYSVLVVPSLDFNLLSDVQTELYFLEVSEGGTDLHCRASATNTPHSSHSPAWLWHKRLRHLSFDSPPNQNPSPEVSTDFPGTDLVNASHSSQNEAPSLPYILESPDVGSSETHPEPTTEVTSVSIVNSSILTSSNTHNTQIRRSGRQNKGISKPVYEPDSRVKVKYPISSYVSSHRLSESYALTVEQLSIVSIPNSVQEALEDLRWKQAMNIKMEALQKNETWKLTSLPSGKKTIGCKWVYTVKLKADGSIDKYKLIEIGPLKQFDVKNVFLNGDLEKEVYVEVPPGVQLPPSKESVVCKLKKALYGLKQSPRAWFGRLTLAMKKFGYKQSNSDHTLFIKHNKGKVAILIVYVDDMVLTGDDVEEMKLLEKKLAPADTPIEMNHSLAVYPDQIETDKHRYQRFMHSPSEEYMTAVYRILRYLKGSLGKEGNLVTWRSKKQKVVARSNAEAEFRGMTYGICELLWIRSVLADLGIKYEQLMNLYCDNKVAVEIAHNPVQHDRTKHVEVDRHFIKEKLDNQVIQTPHVQSEDQLADILIKVVSGKVFEEVINKLGMIDIHAPT
ncbi:uncharacterized protein LOC106770050 [Vigna radiata var. radiata]|uniref:Uncharacterized protein LOC106770050 n=1 Tax=Vigna radiata var. radiata TaxID=3916 RepID=A0A1S3UZ49_VIGRR|nr:uncharacterized protein LOC106770050 [Vigna radiata var. radiata]